jgi:hypothetical protein
VVGVEHPLGEGLAARDIQSGDNQDDVRQRIVAVGERRLKL